VDYVLVHGSTQTSACWQRVAEPLLAAGHRVYAVDLPAGKDDWWIADYAKDVAAQAAGAENPVLVGHSAAGMYLTAIADLLAPRHIVWVAAAIPDFAGGRSFRDEALDLAAGVFSDEWRSWNGDFEEAPAEAAYFLFHDCDLETLRWAMSGLRLFRPANPVAERPTAAPPTAPSTYIVPTADRTLSPPWMREAASARLSARVVEVDAGHCPHISRPAAVADTLLSLAS
jgi:pimeloyl-ACP methyl ester carboxylesterase